MSELNIPKKCQDCSAMREMVEVAQDLEHKYNDVLAESTLAMGGVLEGRAQQLADIVPDEILKLTGLNREDFAAQTSAATRAGMAHELDVIDAARGEIQDAATEFTRGCTGPVVMQGIGQRAAYTVKVCDSPAITAGHIGHEHPDEPTVVKREPRRKFSPRSES